MDAPADITYRVDASNDLVSWCTNDGCVLAGAISINTNGTATVTTEGDVAVPSSQKEFLRLDILDSSGTAP